MFGIHPLTTEDIQMEETREKIELFRNYYLVCFRSFDQDPYSPTFLEPLNIYIIVFREGTLSVSHALPLEKKDLKSNCFFTVSLQSDTASAECATANQATEGLHKCDVGLGVVCLD